MKRELRVDLNDDKQIKYVMPFKADLVAYSDAYLVQHPSAWNKGKIGVVERELIARGRVLIKWIGGGRSSLHAMHLRIVEESELF